MSREVQVRFCESRGVRFPPATHRVIHCASQYQARKVLAALHERMAEVGLELHGQDQDRVLQGQQPAQLI
jgi:hypothetical protein